MISSRRVHRLVAVLGTIVCSSCVPRGTCFLATSRRRRDQAFSSSTFISGASNSGDDEGDFYPMSSSNNNTIVTKEMFLRDLLKDPNDSSKNDDEKSPPSVTVKRKNNKKGRKNKPYKVLDNRDQLPFGVTVTTPDPYTHPTIKKQNAAARNQAPKKKRHDAIENGISSSLYMDNAKAAGGKKRKKNQKQSKASSSSVDTSTFLGEFVLDKYTTTGDLLEIGEQQFQVVRHKCQYKYAGGQRFVMVRKILQVKEVGRLKTEEYLSSLLSSSSSSSSREERF